MQKEGTIKRKRERRKQEREKRKKKEERKGKREGTGIIIIRNNKHQAETSRKAARRKEEGVRITKNADNKHTKNTKEARMTNTVVEVGLLVCIVGGICRSHFMHSSSCCANLYFEEIKTTSITSK